MPYRIALTGQMQGPEVSKILKLLDAENGELQDCLEFVRLPSRMEMLKDWLQK